MFAILDRFTDKPIMRSAVVSAIVFASLAGCITRGRGLADDDLSFKVPAIKEAVQDDQRSAIPRLVVELDDDDSAVRFYAIEALRRMTGQTFGYHYYDDAPARIDSVSRWQKWLTSQQRGASESKAQQTEAARP